MGLTDDGHESGRVADPGFKGSKTETELISDNDSTAWRVNQVGEDGLSPCIELIKNKNNKKHVSEHDTNYYYSLLP